MANEILVLRETPQSDGLETYLLMFVHLINPVISVNGVLHVPTPSSTMPDEVVAFNLLTASELAAFDNGQALFQIHSFKRNRRVSQAEMVEQVKADWQTQENFVVPTIRASLSKTGTRINV